MLSTATVFSSEICGTETPAAAAESHGKQQDNMMQCYLDQRRVVGERRQVKHTAAGQLDVRQRELFQRSQRAQRPDVPDLGVI